MLIKKVYKDVQTGQSLIIKKIYGLQENQRRGEEGTGLSRGGTGVKKVGLDEKFIVNNRNKKERDGRTRPRGKGIWGIEEQTKGETKRLRVGRH